MKSGAGNRSPERRQPSEVQRVSDRAEGAGDLAELAVFGQRHGDMVNAAEPSVQLAIEAKAVLAQVAIEGLLRLRHGPRPGTVVPPFEIVDPPHFMEDLVQDACTMAKTPFDGLMSVRTWADTAKIAHAIHADAGQPFPIVLRDPEGRLIYDNLEIVIARWLLGESQVYVKLVDQPPSESASAATYQPSRR